MGVALCYCHPDTQTNMVRVKAELGGKVNKKQWWNMRTDLRTSKPSVC